MIIKQTYLESEVLYQVMELLYLQLKELMHELAPEGWNNSPYHFPFEIIEGESEVLYNGYQMVAQAYEQQFGRCPRRYLEEATKTMNMVCKTNTHDTPIGEMVYLIEFALVRLTQNGLLFKASDPATYYVIDEFDIAEQSYLLGIELTLPGVAFCNIPLLSPARHELLFHLDLSVLYAHLLKAFAQLHYDWRYYNEALKMQWIRWRIAKIVNRNDGENSQQSLWIQLKESIASIERVQPPNEVLAYMGTHDKLPVGYPPTMEDLEYVSRIT